MSITRSKHVCNLGDLISIDENNTSKLDLVLVYKNGDFKKFINMNIDRYTKKINSRVSNKIYGIILVLFHGSNSDFVENIIDNCL